MSASPWSLKSDWQSVFAAYRHPLMLQVLLNGVVSGLPWAMFGSLLSLWLQSAGYSRSQIGGFGIIAMAYTMNLFWAPIIDRFSPFKIPKTTPKQAWIVAMQCTIVICMLLVTVLDIREHIVLLVALMVMAAIAGATQDVAIDAMRIETTRPMGPAVLAAGSAMATIGWWSGYGMGGALSIASVDWFAHYMPERAWQMSYLLLALLSSICIGTQFYTRRFVTPPKTGAAPQDKEPLNINVLWRLYADPIRAFLNNHGAKIGLTLLAIIFFFKIGEAFLGRMSILFYGEYFSRADIALYSKGLGSLTYCVFAIFASVLSIRYGLLRGVIIGGVLMASTNLLFALLAAFPTKELFAFTVVADQMTTAISTVAFVAFISQLCDERHAATHYAALASIGNFARTSLAVFSGLMVDGLDGNWSLFFIITTLMVLPSLALLLWVKNKVATGN